MNRYTIPCTEEQTKKALELGAPILLVPEMYGCDEPHFRMEIEGENASVIYPTTEQMIGWLNIEKKIFVMVHPYVSMYHEDEYDAILINLCNGHMLSVKNGCDNNKEATLAAIDAALEYLINNKK